MAACLGAQSGPGSGGVHAEFRRVARSDARGHAIPSTAARAGDEAAGRLSFRARCRVLSVMPARADAPRPDRQRGDDASRRPCRRLGTDASPTVASRLRGPRAVRVSMKKRESDRFNGVFTPGSRRSRYRECDQVVTPPVKIRLSDSTIGPLSAPFRTSKMSKKEESTVPWGRPPGRNSLSSGRACGPPRADWSVM